MNKPRVRIPAAVRDAVLKEYSHLCAICGKANPQLHHIDENPANNAEENLLPLCPNHHLTDQHSPTRRIEPERLKLFRKHKDPAILSPQFVPLFCRLQRLKILSNQVGDPAGTEHAAGDLIRFVQALAMGSYYGERLKELIGPPPFGSVPRGAHAVLPIVLERGRARHVEKIEKHSSHLEPLIVELLRFQRWYPPDYRATSA